MPAPAIRRSESRLEDLVAYLEDGARRRADETLYVFLDSSGETVDSYTYRRFHERSNHVAARLSETGAVPFGQPVLLVYEPGLEMLVAFFACLKLGALPVPVAPPAATGFKGGVRKLALVAGDAGAKAVLTSRRCLAQAQALLHGNRSKSAGGEIGVLASLEWIRTDDLRGEQPEFAGRVNPIMFLQYTSGSTEDPRGVVVAHRNIIHNGRATVCGRPVGVTWLPHYHDMGLIGYYLNAVLSGGLLVAFSDFSFMRRPVLWLEAITKFRGTITSAPNFAYEHLLREDVVSDADLASLDLRSVECMMNASEPVRCETMTRFADRFARCGLSPDAVTAAYGLAEATLTVSQGGRRQLAVNADLLWQGRLQIDSAPRADSALLASCGRPLDGLDVRIVDPQDGRPVPEDRIGEVWLRGGSKTQGYWNRPALSNALFAASMVNGSRPHRYLRTGDLGFLHEGELFICGRLKDIIIFRGKNYYPQDIESVVERLLPAGRAGTVAAFAIGDRNGEDALAIVAEVKAHRALPDGERIREEVRRHFRLEVEVFAAVKPGSIARTSSGKIARFECRRRWLAGKMEILSCHRRGDGDAPERVLQDVLEALDFPGADELTLGEAGLDSLALVSLSLCIKQALDVQGQADADVLFDLKMLQTITVGEMKRLIDAFRRQQLAVGAAREACCARLRAVERRETDLMRRDAQLAADVAPSGASLPSPGGKVVLTGATGFFGRFLLDALLRLSDSEVVVVARAREGEDAQRRVESALMQITPRDPTAAEALRRRVLVLDGDLARPRLGLAEGCWQRICEEASAIYHCGATVDYVRPYEVLRKANVEGTQEALRLACAGRAKAFHLVSTTFIFGWSAPRLLLESDGNPSMEELDFGYAQTKWVAEQLAFEAARRGLRVAVYRPSLITASRRGDYIRHDITARVLSYMIRHKVAVDVDNQISFLPADVAADNLIALSRLAESPATTYHLTADRYYSFPVVTEAITRRFGYGFRYVDVEAFVDHINHHCTKRDLLYPLVPFFNKNFRKLDRMRHKRYDNRNYRAGRELSAACCPEPPLEETVGAIVEFLRREQLIP